jgi:hypothetical protein
MKTPSRDTLAGMTLAIVVGLAIWYTGWLIVRSPW